MLLAYLVLALTTQRPPAVLQHFRSVATESIPGSLVAKICSDRDESDCAETFRTNGRAWTGDINDDGASEYVIFDGHSCGTLGCSYDLFESHTGKWSAIPVFMSGSDPDVPLWISNRPRLDILPIVRDGYHDLRIAVDECVKWNGHEYVAYQPDDYRRLSPSLFNRTDSHEAEIFWMIRYAGLSEFAFTPRWFPISGDEFLRQPRALMLLGGTLTELPRVPASRLKDSTENLLWVGLSRGGVWAIRNNRGFLLAPQQAYLGARSLQFRGDWLSIAEDLDGENPEIEYNRRTHILRMNGQIP